MLTRIRNAIVPRHETVMIPASKMKLELARILKEEGFIRDYEAQNSGKSRPQIKIHLHYRSKDESAISGLKRVSKPGLRVYVGKKEIPRSYGGMAVSIAPLIAPTFIMSGWGSRMLGASGVIALIMTWVWMSDVRTFVMASTAHGLKIAEGVPGRRRPLFWAIVLAIVLTLVCSIGTLLFVAYAYGGINLHSWYFVGGPQIPYRFATAHIDKPLGPHWGGWAWTAVGAAGVPHAAKTTTTSARIDTCCSFIVAPR